MSIRAYATGWILETQQTAYTLGIHPNGMLVHRYWGAKLPRLEDYPSDIVTGDSVKGSLGGMVETPFDGLGNLLPEEYPAQAGTKTIEPCLKVTFSDGVRDVVLRFERAEIVSESEVPELEIHLRDAHYPLEVVLHYRVWEAYDLIVRWAAVFNHGETPIVLERFWSAQWHPPVGGHYYLSHLTGRWANEFQMRREPLLEGVKVLESRRLTTSHHHSPWFAIDRGQIEEEHGDLWFGVLAWSGNWKIAAEVTSFATTRVSIGLNDWDFAWQLDPGQSLTAPSSYAGFTPHGYGAASRTLHDFIRDVVIPHGNNPHKVLFNSWETTFFAVDEASQMRFADMAADMGIELFVMDDGWFHGRDSDHSSLGDWWPDEQKFPNGLGPLIEHVNRLGMDFGLWIEPEMVNPDSELYRQHPDWVIHFPTRSRTEARNQLILNVAKPEVQDYLIQAIDTLLADYNIAFIKWDMNRNVSEPGWSDAPADPRELWVRYVWGVYRIWSTLRERHPNVIWQSCSGGGGRADLGILRLADQVWVSDNTIPTSRLTIQAGFSQVFPAMTMESWVTDMGEDFLPLKFRFHVSMLGSLGVGADLRKWNDRDFAEARQWIALYKEIRPIIQQGDMFRLNIPFDFTTSAIQYVSKDKLTSVLFVFAIYRTDPSLLLLVYPRGLDSNAVYSVEGLSEKRSGAAWMSLGIRLNLGNLDSALLRIQVG